VEVEPIGKYLHADELAKENLKLFKQGEVRDQMSLPAIFW